MNRSCRGAAGNVSIQMQRTKAKRDGSRWNERKASRPKRPRDVNELAKLIVDLSTGEVEDSSMPNRYTTVPIKAAKKKAATSSRETKSIYPVLRRFLQFLPCQSFALPPSWP